LYLRKDRIMRSYFLRASAWVAIFCAVCSLSCRSKEPSESDANKPGPNTVKIDTKTVTPDINAVEPKTATVRPADNVLVTVNGVDITEADLEILIKPHLDRLAKQPANRPPAIIEQYKKMVRQQALPLMIKIRLLEEKAKQANITVTDEDVTNELTKTASLQKPPVTLEELKKKIEASGYNFEQWKDQMRTLLTHQKLITLEYPDKVKVTEEDTKAYYEQTKSRWPEQTRASHILIKPDLSDPNSDPNEANALAKAKAEDLLKQIKEGADFAELAKAHSACPSGPGGGDLNFFPRTGKGSMVAEFSDAAFALEVGGISDVVKTTHGYHIIKVTDRREGLSFEQVKDSLMNELVQRRLYELGTEYFEKVKGEAKIVYPPGKEPKPAAPPVLPGGTPVR